MNLYIGNKTYTINGEPKVIFSELAKMANMSSDIDFNLMNYAEILHTLCYMSSITKYSHIDQVYHNMLILNKIYASSRYSVEMLKIAAVYHDIAKLYDNDNHAKLAANQIKYDDVIISEFLTSDQIEEISTAILNHSYKAISKKNRRGKLSKLLYDADAIRCMSEFKDSNDFGYFIEYVESLYFKLSKSIMIDMFTILTNRRKVNV